MIKSFTDLEVYQESFQLSIEIDQILKTFPNDERYLLIDQMKRCSRAIPAIIAEGYAKRESIKEFQKFLRDALGEANEMLNHLAFSKARRFISEAKSNDLIERYSILGKKLTNLKNNWRKFD